jgi:hypothetical protein
MLRDPSAARQAARVAASFDRQSTHFRLALLIVAALLVVLGALRLTGPAIAVAAAGVPLLYLLYLFDMDVYEEEPVRVAGLIFGLGLLLDIPWALWTGPAVTRSVLRGAWSGSLTDGVLIDRHCRPFSLESRRGDRHLLRDRRPPAALGSTRDPIYIAD